MELSIVFTILGLALVLFVTELVPIDVTALLILGALVASGVLTPEEGGCRVSRTPPR